MARTLDEIGKKCPAEGWEQWPHEKPQLENARKLRARNWKRQWLLLCLVRQARTRIWCESTRLRMGHSLPNHDNSLQHSNLVHKFIPMSQAMKNPAATAAVDEEWEKIEHFFGVEPDESQKYERGDR